VEEKPIFAILDESTGIVEEWERYPLRAVRSTLKRAFDWFLGTVTPSIVSA
jgi:hypothetical protein